MRIAAMWRYPVKSMLGERLDEVLLDQAGLAWDRGLAVLEVASGFVGSAKQPRLWRDLLKYAASVQDGQVVITSPAGWIQGAPDPDVDRLLSKGLAREVRVSSRRPAAAELERPDPLDVLEHGVEAVVEAPTLAIGQGTPGENFVDYAPVHLITSATLDAIGVEQIRYRPNLVVATPPGTPAFVENSWVGRELHVTGAAPVVLRVSIPTPRCAIPTLEHGELPRSPHAVRMLMTANRVDVEGFGVLPCAGGYAEVVHGGTVRVGDELTVH